MVTSDIGEGQAFFADDISQCVVGQTVKASNSIFNSSIFSRQSLFDFRQGLPYLHCFNYLITFRYNNISNRPYFETTPQILILVS